jgi:hypothetical protein
MNADASPHFKRMNIFRCPSCSASGILWKLSLWRRLGAGKRCTVCGNAVKLVAPWGFGLFSTLLITAAGFAPFFVLAFWGAGWFAISLVLLVVIVPIIIGLLSPIQAMEIS